MLTRLVILWLLAEQPHHGYRLKRILADEGLSVWFPIEDASIYSMLRTLVREKHARPIRTERRGGRPSRTVYGITREGRRHYADLLRRAWRDPVSATDPVQLALAASGDLPDDEVEILAQERLASLRQRERHLQQLRSAAPAVELFDRETARLRGEIRWLQSWIEGRSNPNGKGESP